MTRSSVPRFRHGEHLRERMKQIALPPFVIAAARNTFVATPKLKMLLDDEGNVRVARAIQAAFPDAPDAPVDIICIDLMLADLGVVKSHSRPHTSNDNPFSEAQFKTLEYQPESPKRFQTIDVARACCRRFFAWYNEDNYHAGIGLMTPEQIHFGQASQIHAARQTDLDAAFPNTPERFVRKHPKPPQVPTAVWINPPRKTVPS